MTFRKARANVNDTPEEIETAGEMPERPAHHGPQVDIAAAVSPSIEPKLP